MTTLSRPHGYGDSDLCKQDPSHGATYSTVRGDWCPHSLHKGDQFTAAPPRSAPEIPAPLAPPELGRPRKGEPDRARSKAEQLELAT